MIIIHESRERETERIREKDNEREPDIGRLTEREELSIICKRFFSAHSSAKRPV